MARFADVFEDVTKQGRKIPAAEYLENGRYPIIDQGQSEIAGYTNEPDGLFLDVPAIVFGDHTRVLKYIDKPCFLGADGVKLLKAIIPNPNYKYLFYALANIDIPDTGYNRHYKWLKEADLSIPNAEKQRHIAAVLDRVSALIALRKQQLAKLDELVKARFVEMFGDPKDNRNGWPVLPLGKLFTVSSSKRIYQSEQTNNGIPFLRISDLVQRMDGGEETAELYISEQHYTALQNEGLVPAAGDILVTSRGTLGRCYEVKENDRFYFQDGMISWLFDKNPMVTTTYIMQLFQMPGFRNQIGEVPAGSTVNYLSLSRLKELRVMCPSTGMQEQFAAFVAQTDKSKLAVQQGLDKLETLKKALMQEYLG